MEAEKKVQLRILMNHLKKEATDPGNFDDAAIHHNGNIEDDYKNLKTFCFC